METTAERMIASRDIKQAGLVTICCQCHKVKKGNLWFYAKIAHIPDGQKTHGLCPRCKEQHLKMCRGTNRIDVLTLEKEVVNKMRDQNQTMAWIFKNDLLKVQQEIQRRRKQEPEQAQHSIPTLLHEIITEFFDKKEKEICIL